MRGNTTGILCVAFTAVPSHLDLYKSSPESNGQQSTTLRYTSRRHILPSSTKGNPRSHLMCSPPETLRQLTHGMIFIFTSYHKPFQHDRLMIFERHIPRIAGSPRDQGCTHGELCSEYPKNVSLEGIREIYITSDARARLLLPYSCFVWDKATYSLVKLAIIQPSEL